MFQIQCILICIRKYLVTHRSMQTHASFRAIQIKFIMPKFQMQQEMSWKLTSKSKYTTMHGHDRKESLVPSIATQATSRTRSLVNQITIEIFNSYPWETVQFRASAKFQIQFFRKSTISPWNSILYCQENIYKWLLNSTTIIAVV